MACRLTDDLQILESLLIKLRSLLKSPQSINDFLERKNNDDLRALDYCAFKNRGDMAIILQEFVHMSQSVVNIESF